MLNIPCVELNFLNELHIYNTQIEQGIAICEI